MALMYDAMDIVHENSVSAISLLQSRFHQQRELMFMVSTLFDPRYAFLFFSPLVFSLDRYAGRKLMWVSVIAEWSNQVLKWVLHGERPYWWVLEQGSHNKTLPTVQQYYVTCETGPGSPSGHAMVTAAVWFIIIEALLRNRGSLTKRSLVNRLCWSVYTIIICIVSLSRVYIGAHFPHQCLLGMVIGVAVAMLVSNLDTDSLEKKHYIFGTFGLLMSALSTFAALKMMGMNPMWSVDRAVKWCAKQEYIHMDTTPFFSMARYGGFFLGMGFGLHSDLHKTASRTRFTTVMKLCAAILAISASKASEYVALPKSNLTLFYGLAFVMSATLAYIFIAVVPYAVSKISATPAKRKSL